MRFKFKSFKSFARGFLVLIFLFNAFYIYGAWKGLGKHALLIYVVFSSFMLVTGFFSLAVTADLKITDRGVSRRFGSATLQSIEWVDVKIIKVFIVSSVTGHKRYFNIFPKKHGMFSIFPIGKIAFDDSMDNYFQFRAIFNDQIKSAQLEVWQKENGTTLAVDKI